jgi:hypothetical protein
MLNVPASAAYSLFFKAPVGHRITKKPNQPNKQKPCSKFCFQVPIKMPMLKVPSVIRFELK